MRLDDDFTVGFSTVDASTGEREIHQSVRGLAVDMTIENAIIYGMNRVGQLHDLPPMRWNVGGHGGAALEGRPVDDCDDVVGACEAWARALQLDEYRWDMGGGVRGWFLAEGEWHIEITTERGRR